MFVGYFYISHLGMSCFYFQGLSSVMKIFFMIGKNNIPILQMAFLTFAEAKVVAPPLHGLVITPNCSPIAYH